MTHCDERGATLKAIDNRKTNDFDRLDHRVLYARYPFSIIELISHQ
jgi:hypothetical protein